MPSLVVASVMQKSRTGQITNDQFFAKKKTIRNAALFLFFFPQFKTKIFTVVTILSGLLNNKLTDYCTDF